MKDCPDLQVLFLSRMAFGSPLVRLDLVAPDFQIASNLSRRGELKERRGVKAKRAGRGNHLYSFPLDHHAGTTFASVETIGTLFEDTYIGRNNEVRCLLSAVS